MVVMVAVMVSEEGSVTVECEVVELGDGGSGVKLQVLTLKSEVMASVMGVFI